MATAGSELPYVAVAVFCERVLQETEGFHSVIRILDQVTGDPLPPPTEEEISAYQIELSMYLLFRSAGDPRSAILTIDHQLPDTTLRRGKGSSPLQLRGPGHGASMLVTMRIELDMPGVHWFNVAVDGTILTRVPLTFVFRPTEPATEATAGV